MQAVGIAGNPRTNVARWVARALATVFLVLLVKQGRQEISHLLGEQSPGDHVFSVGFLTMLLGAVVGWFREGTGGALMVVGYAVVVATVATASAMGLAEAFEAIAMSLTTLPFLVAGLLLLRSTRRRGVP